MSDDNLNSYREATASDPTLQALIECTKNGWLSKEKIPSNIQPFAFTRDELTIVKGLILKCTRVAKPISTSTPRMIKLSVRVMTAKDNERNKRRGNKYNKDDNLLSYLQVRAYSSW